MAKGKILMSQPIHEAGIKLITDQGYVARVAQDFTEGTLIKEVQDADGFLVRTAEIPASVINAGKQLRVIARHGVGYDNIDVRRPRRGRFRSASRPGPMPCRWRSMSSP